MLLEQILLDKFVQTAQKMKGKFKSHSITPNQLKVKDITVSPTWMQIKWIKGAMKRQKQETPQKGMAMLAANNCSPLFYPSWTILL